LEVSTNLTGTSWTAVGTPVTGDGNPAVFNLGTTNSQSYFRIRVIP
jgi:hypothetical protein